MVLPNIPVASEIVTTYIIATAVFIVITPIKWKKKTSVDFHFNFFVSVCCQNFVLDPNSWLNVIEKYHTEKEKPR